MDNYVGLGEIKISSTPGDVIKTFALASCVTVTAYCPITQTAGMIHIVLPDRSCSVDGNIMCPAYYAVTGVPLLIQQMISHGCRKKDLIINVYAELIQ